MRSVMNPRKSAITDVYFVPEADARDSFVPAGSGDVAVTDHLISLVYEEPLTAARERYAKGLLAGDGLIGPEGRAVDGFARNGHPHSEKRIVGVDRGPGVEPNHMV